jgi:hypothetical protein
VIKTQGLRRFKTSDYKTMVRWYEDWEVSPPAREDISDLGFVLHDSVICFIFITNSNVAMIEGLVADRALLPKKRAMLVKQMCSIMTDVCVAMGYTTVIAITDHPSVEHICDNLGFQEVKKKVFALVESPEELLGLEDDEVVVGDLEDIWDS